MDDYIRKQAAVDALIEWYGCEPNDIDAFENIIEKIPPADVAEVVRCKDCRYLDYRRRCEMFELIHRSDTDYCSEGRKRND